MTNVVSDWTDHRTFHLTGLRVSLSEPVLVRRSRRYLWFPSLLRLSDGDVIATMSSQPDKTASCLAQYVTRSRDGGLTWDEPAIAIDGGDVSLVLPSGDTMLLPYLLRPRADGMGAPYNLFPANRKDFINVASGVEVTGWPRPVGTFKPSELGLSGFVFTGQTVNLQDDGFLATLSGGFLGTKRSSLVAAESSDGVRWAIRSVVDDETCALLGNGPSESALCRLPDGRLMCVFRSSGAPYYGQTWSSDEGKTWSTPVGMTGGVRSVQPSLVVMKRGFVALSGGRPGLYLWLNVDGTGLGWQSIDMLAHHNECCPGEVIDDPSFHTTCYTEILALDDTHLLYIYDRIPNRWDPIPEEMDDTNSVWVLRVTVNEVKV